MRGFSHHDLQLVLVFQKLGGGGSLGVNHPVRRWEESRADNSIQYNFLYENFVTKNPFFDGRHRLMNPKSE